MEDGIIVKRGSFVLDGRCVTCGALLDQVPSFIVTNGRASCAKHFHQACRSCKLVIPANGAFVAAEEGPYHTACFKCVRCGDPLSGSYTFDHATGAPLCGKCEKTGAPAGSAAPQSGTAVRTTTLRPVTRERIQELGSPRRTAATNGNTPASPQLVLTNGRNQEPVVNSPFSRANGGPSPMHIRRGAGPVLRSAQVAHGGENGVEGGTSPRRTLGFGQDSGRFSRSPRLGAPGGLSPDVTALSPRLNVTALKRPQTQPPHAHPHFPAPEMMNGGEGDAPREGGREPRLRKGYYDAPNAAIAMDGAAGSEQVSPRRAGTVVQKSPNPVREGKRVRPPLVYGEEARTATRVATETVPAPVPSNPSSATLQSLPVPSWSEASTPPTARADATPPVNALGVDALGSPMRAAGGAAGESGFPELKPLPAVGGGKKEPVEPVSALPATPSKQGPPKAEVPPAKAAEPVTTKAAPTAAPAAAPAVVPAVAAVATPAVVASATIAPTVTATPTAKAFATVAPAEAKPTAPAASATPAEPQTPPRTTATAAVTVTTATPELPRATPRDQPLIAGQMQEPRRGPRSRSPSPARATSPRLSTDGARAGARSPNRGNSPTHAKPKSPTAKPSPRPPSSGASRSSAAAHHGSVTRPRRLSRPDPNPDHRMEDDHGQLQSLSTQQLLPKNSPNRALPLGKLTPSMLAGADTAPVIFMQGNTRAYSEISNEALLPNQIDMVVVPSQSVGVSSARIASTQKHVAVAVATDSFLSMSMGLEPPS